MWEAGFSVIGTKINEILLYSVFCLFVCLMFVCFVFFFFWGGGFN